MFNSTVNTISKLIFTILLLLLLATTALATGESINIDAFDTNNCIAGSNADGTVTHINGTTGVSIRFTLTNLTQGTSETWTAGLLGSGTHSYSVPVPASTMVGDVMQHTLEMLDGAAAVVAVDTLNNYYCGGVAPPAVPEPEPQPPFIDGRINNWDTGSSVVLFPFSDGDSYGLNIYSADGEGLILNIPASIIDAVSICPEDNSLIFNDSISGISLWRLAQGADGVCPFQLNALATEPGKTYIIVFNELFSGTYYESWEE